MDSLIVKKLIDIISTQDSLMLHTKKLEEVVNASKPSLLLQLLPFIGVIVGGVIAYTGQNILKNKELKLTRLTTINSAVNKIFSNLTCLTFYLKELAYLEVDSKYQFYLSLTEQGKFKDRALEEHYDDYKYAAELKSKTAIAVSEIDSSFASYYRLKNQSVPANTATILNTFGNHLINLKKHYGFDEETVVETEQVHRDVENLFSEYNKLILPIRQLATAL
jgi:hypothetical protein